MRGSKMARKGMMVGTGKRGYHNVIGRDPAVHSQSAKGIKQPQQVNIIPSISRKEWNETPKDYKSIIKGTPHQLRIENGGTVLTPVKIIKKEIIVDPIKKIRGKQIIIKGRRWFDKANGNTYHSTEVYVDGKLIGSAPMRYGYGDQYYETGKEILADKGFIEYERTKENIPVYRKGVIDYYTPKESQNKDEAFRKFEDYRRDNNYDKILTFVDDVSRKKDL
jgi:hypothetical protein